MPRQECGDVIVATIRGRDQHGTDTVAHCADATLHRIPFASSRLGRGSETRRPEPRNVPLGKGAMSRKGTTEAG